MEREEILKLQPGNLLRVPSLGGSLANRGGCIAYVGVVFASPRIDALLSKHR